VSFFKGVSTKRGDEDFLKIFSKAELEGFLKKTIILVSREAARISRDVALITAAIERTNNATPINVTVPAAIVCESTIRFLYTNPA
jgi:hypothetical protein